MAKWKPGGPGRPPAHIAKRRSVAKRKSSGRRKVAAAARRRKSITAATMGRRGGSAGTAKQHAARKRNAVRAGRPRKICIFCSEPVKGGHKDPRLDESCGRHAFVYRQHTEGGPTVTRADVLIEIAALNRLYESLPEADAVPEPPLVSPEEQPTTRDGAVTATDPNVRRLDPETLQWREPEPPAEAPAEEPQQTPVPF